MIEAFPLYWPAGYPRTKYPQSARFDTSFANSRDAIIREIKLLGGKNPIISTNIPLKRDGLPYATYKQPDDAGVSVYFTYEKEQVVFACDKWKQIHDNMQAIRKAIEAVRGLDRWGVSEMLKRAFSGFKALPEQASKNESSWWEILEVSPTAGVDGIRSAWKSKIKIHHPDNGGTHEMFIVIQKAYEEGMSKIETN